MFGRRMASLACSFLAMLGSPAWCQQQVQLNIKAPNAEVAGLYNEGVALMAAGKREQAVEKYRQTIAIAPNFAPAHFNLGAVLMMLGNTREAQQELEKTVSMDATIVPAWATLGSCYQLQGQTDKALDAFQHYLRLAPQGADAAKVRSLTVMLEREKKRSAGIVETDKDYLNDAVINGIVRWNESQMPLQVYIKPGDGVPKYRPELEDILKAAFKSWEEASQGKVRFEFTTDPNKANIACSWTNDPTAGISTAEGGHTLVVPSPKGNGILSATISLLTITTSGDALEPNYARRVFLHEVGHSIGLLGHSKNPADMMFSMIAPGNRSADVTDRDKATLIALYEADPSKFTGKLDDPNKMIGGDPNSKETRVLLLNNEAKVALDKGNVPVAVHKLEEAHGLDPSNPIVCSNLGSAYANLGSMAMMVRNIASAESYYKKAIPLLESGTNRYNLAPVLKNYSAILKLTNRTQEAAKIDEKLQSLGAH